MSESCTLLIEIGTEELPPAVVTNGPAPFAHELFSRLENKKFLGQAPSPLQCFCTPRRIAVKIPNVATHQPTETVERKGPPATKIDENDPKAQGFAKSCGVEVGELELRDGRLFCHAETGGKPLVEVLPELLPATLNQLTIPRRMRWGAGEQAFARPVRWLCILHGNEVIDCELFGVKSGRVTYGHRHYLPDKTIDEQGGPVELNNTDKYNLPCRTIEEQGQPVKLDNADKYENTLEENRVIVDLLTRREQIEEQISQTKKALLTETAKALLTETAATTEWPQALTATFDKTFLSLPPEVITQTLEHTLKVFPKRDQQRQLLPEFTIIADIESKDPQTIVHGYENVVRARLEDAKFFFEQDKKTSLEDRRAILKRTLFQEKLGTLADKAQRIGKLVASFASRCGASPEHTQRAAQLCKCDLDTSLVGEYPELQGVMGGYYAKADGEHEAVAVAIREHYLPQGRGEMPASPEGAALAIADKIDTLTGFWGAGLEPSGSKDPYGLRRATNGILRILIKRKIDLDIEELVNEAISGYGGGSFNENLNENLCKYIVGQLCSDVFVKSFPQHTDKTHDCVRAVDRVFLTMKNQRASDFFSRLDAVASFVNDPAADSLIAANKRIRNILKKVNVKQAAPDFDAMTEDAERDLFEAMKTQRGTFDRQFDAQDYTGAMETLAKLRKPVDRFFDEVMVMSENEKERDNRLALLADIRTLFLKIADFSELSAGKTEAKK